MSTFYAHANMIDGTQSNWLNELSLDQIPTDCLGIFSDIDDTLTDEGLMVPAAFQALADLKDQGLKVILVTGRPAGWVDHIARMWPVDAVVGENGGLWFYMQNGKLQQSFLNPVTQRQKDRQRLDTLAQEILSTVKGCALASDQEYRALDLAIDFCEDVDALPIDEVHRIVDLFQKAGATAKISSIHVNGWFGTWDKWSGCVHLMQEAWGIDLQQQKEKWIYFGDSANDEPMFNTFTYSVGVHNVLPFLAQMKAHPTWITQKPGGLGFVEAVRYLFLDRI